MPRAIASSTRIVDVDAVDDLVVHRAEHLDVVGDEPAVPFVHVGRRRGRHREVLEGRRGRVRVGAAHGQLGRIEERQRRAVGHREEGVDVRHRLPAEDALVEVGDAHGVVRDEGGVAPLSTGPPLGARAARAGARPPTGPVT
jgi:hypothetical protein